MVSETQGRLPVLSLTACKEEYKSQHYALADHHCPKMISECRVNASQKAESTRDSQIHFDIMAMPRIESEYS